MIVICWVICCREAGKMQNATNPRSVVQICCITRAGLSGKIIAFTPNSFQERSKSDGDVSDRGLSTVTGFRSVSVAGLSYIDVSLRWLVSDPPGVSLVAGVVFGSSPVSE